LIYNPSIFWTSQNQTLNQIWKKHLYYVGRHVVGYSVLARRKLLIFKMWHDGGFRPVVSAGRRAYKIRIKCNLKMPSTVSDQIYSDSHPRYSHKYIIMDWILRVLLSGVSLCARHPTLSHPLGFRKQKSVLFTSDNGFIYEQERRLLNSRL